MKIQALTSLITKVYGTIVAIDTLMNGQINVPNFSFSPDPLSS